MRPAWSTQFQDSQGDIVILFQTIPAATAVAGRGRKEKRKRKMLPRYKTSDFGSLKHLPTATRDRLAAILTYKLNDD